ncbi:MAG: peptide chain release factor N(5)-glutamine methyltransferase [Microcoleaceae cyanobacterium MO_207.B10]|nr:peptide chain release factor N(5)-glutamine methyltransferase [Microcoleaceae cyanobacterium MO_207.B10]
MDFQSNFVISGQELWKWYYQAKVAALKADIPTTEVDWFLGELVGLDRLTLRLECFKDWPKIPRGISMEELDRLWRRRLDERVPLQYLIGVAYWRNFSLDVGTGVLIPRPETECLIDLALAATNTFPNLREGNWVDLGTGSGAIAFGLAEVLTNGSIYAVDCSSEALTIARKNAAKLGLSDRVIFYHGSWWQPLEHLRGQISGMVANPPYIPSSMIPSLQCEVSKHEPLLALDGGSDGLDCIRYLISTAPTYLVSGGVWLVEMMAGQAKAVTEMLEAHGSYSQVQIFSDLEGVDRFALAYLI